MARMPGAHWLGEHSPRRPMSRYDIVCVHTIVGYAPAHAAHFSTHDNGRIDQSRDTKYRSAANLDGNHRVIAIENEDGAKNVPLTDAQVTACAKILAWAHRTHGVPLQLAPNSKPGSRGLAYHRQGIDGNFGGYKYPGRVDGGEKWSSVYGKTCPRDNRIAQLPEILRRAKLIAYPPPATITSDISVVLANVRSTPLMTTAQAKADYEIAFSAAAKGNDQAVYINEFHTSYTAALDAVAKKYGYIVKKQGGLAVAYRRNRWTLSGFAYSLITKGVSGITPNRGVLRLGNTTPTGTRVVFDCTMFPRGWMNPKYAEYATTHPLGVKLAKGIAAIVKSQTGTLKSAALVGGDVNIGSLMNWTTYGVKPAASCMGTPDALDKMMQLHLFVPAGWTAKLVKVAMVPGNRNTDHGIVRAHFQVTRPR